MIIVTGTGRSGTSLVAQLYKELGFDISGRWLAHNRAGFEAREIADVNRAIEKYLGMGSLGGHKRSLRKSVRRVVRRVRKARLRGPRLDSMPAWDRFGLAVERYGPRLRELSKSHAVAKDPRFCSTLRVWAQAGAEIEHVLVTVRSLDAVARSSIIAGQAGRASIDVLRNALVYRLGLCMTTLHDYGLEHRVVAFPDFVQRPETLFEAMRFPRPVSHEAFSAAFDRVVQPGIITELRSAAEVRT